MYTYDDITMEPIPPTLGPGQKLHILVPQDECIAHVNETPRKVWLLNGEQPLRKKGNGRAIMISDWIIETCGRLRLSPEQIAHQATLPEASCLRVTDTRRIIYPGENHDKWWDLAQLKEQLKDAVDIFEYLHPDAVAIWVFDCSSSHEGLASDALNVHNMNVNPGGKQTRMRNTIIPLNNPPPKDGMVDTRGHVQTMVFPEDHLDPKLAGQAKGMLAVLKERESVYDRLVQERGSEKKVVGKCAECRKSAVKKDAERRVAMAEMAGQDDCLDDNVLEEASQVVDENANKWCCMSRVISLQDDFINEKPDIQHYLEGRGHVCLFYPKFHCEINPIEMLWGYMKYRVSRVLELALILTFVLKAFVLRRMANLQRPKHWCLSVLIWLTHTQFGASSENLGDTWTHIGMMSHSHSSLRLLT